MLSQADLNLTHRSQPAQGTVRMRPSETLFKMAQGTSAGILGQLSSVRSPNQHSYVPLFPVKLQAGLCITYSCRHAYIHCQHVPAYFASRVPLVHELQGWWSSSSRLICPQGGWRNKILAHVKREANASDRLLDAGDAKHCADPLPQTPYCRLGCKDVDHST